MGVSHLSKVVVVIRKQWLIVGHVLHTSLPQTIHNVVRVHDINRRASVGEHGTAKIKIFMLQTTFKLCLAS